MVNDLRENIRAKVNGDYDYRTKFNLINSNGKTASKTKSTAANIKDTSTIPNDRIAYHIYKFQQQFQQEIISKFSDFISIEYRKRVIKAIDDAAGVSLPNFPSFQIIEHLYHEEFERLPDVCYSLLKTIFDYIQENLLKLFDDIFDKDYSRLIQRLREVIIKQVNEAEKRTRERITELLDMEYRLFTLNNEYMEMVDKVTQALADENAAKENKPTTSSSSTTTANPAPATSVKSGSSAALISMATTYISNSLTRSITVDALRPGLNEIRAAPTIQIALDSYCKVRKVRLRSSQ
jgi:transcription-repair coupling factor (superfamily II helicase)